MERLQDDWLTYSPIDFEYKKYLLLAYLKLVEKNFTSNRLYPYLGDLVKQYQNLSSLLESKKDFTHSLPKELESIDLKSFMMHYKAANKDDRLMAELERILDYSIPRIRRQLEEGKEIYQWIENSLHIDTVGIQPLHPHFGFMLLKNGDEANTQVFSYRLTLFEQANEKHRGISTTLLFKVPLGIWNTYAHIKQKLIHIYKLLMPPAVYCVESEIYLPMNETLLPVARKLLAQRISRIL